MRLVEKGLHQFIEPKIIRDYEIRPYSHQPFTFPLVNDETVRLMRRNANSNAIHLLNLLDFDIPIAESEELFAAKLR